MVVANDVFELTPEYQKAFSEAYRVLQPGGKLIFTVPFDGNSLETAVRAEMGDNGLVATTEEWYYESAIPGVDPMIVCQILDGTFWKHCVSVDLMMYAESVLWPK